MEWLAANWFWVVLGLGAAWLFSRGGMGCGMGGHGSHGTHASDRSKTADSTQHGPTTNGHTTEEGRETEETGSGARRRHRGC
jgi:hypothetical protein